MTKEQRIAIFPGSFDPITKGHEALVNRALPLFDKIIIALGNNHAKQYLFNLEERFMFIEQTFHGVGKIEIESYEGLTVDYCRDKGAGYILRGLRNSADFNFEKSISQINNQLYDDIETIFLITQPELAAISSSIIRDILRNGGDATKFLPERIEMP